MADNGTMGGVETAEAPSAVLAVETPPRVPLSAIQHSLLCYN